MATSDNDPKSEREKRDDRLAANLRANLRRRKAAARKQGESDTKSPSS